MRIQSSHSLGFFFFFSKTETQLLLWVFNGVSGFEGVCLSRER